MKSTCRPSQPISPTGTVDLSWAVAPDGTFQLVWREDGGPAVEPSDRRGFGSRLILQVLPKELQGTAEIDFRSSGVVFTLTSTLDAVSDRPALSRG